MGLRKHPKPKKNIRNDERPNKKAWKKYPKDPNRAKKTA